MLVFCLNTPFFVQDFLCVKFQPQLCVWNRAGRQGPFFSKPSLWQIAAMSGSGQLNGHITSSVLGHLGTGQSLQTQFLVLYA